MKIAYIHDNRIINTGAHYVNDLIVNKLKERRLLVTSIYPKVGVDLKNSFDLSSKGLARILSFKSLQNEKENILTFDLIHGTSYTPFALLAFNIPVVTHFGAVTKAYLISIPENKEVEKEVLSTWKELKFNSSTLSFESKMREAFNLISKAEFFTAARATAIVAVSKIVKEDLIKYGDISEDKIFVIYNAIEDYWFKLALNQMNRPKLIFVGRMGEDIFTWKLKGLGRLIKIYKSFPNLEKETYLITHSKKLITRLKKQTENNQVVLNLPRDRLYLKLHQKRGSIFLLTSRYEGFSLSLIEAMSQGIIPVSFPVGVAPEIIANGKNGFLVSSVDEACLRIGQILSNNKLREQLSSTAYTTSFKFKSEILTTKLLALYKKIIKDKIKNRTVLAGENQSL